MSGRTISLRAAVVTISIAAVAGATIRGAVGGADSQPIANDGAERPSNNNPAGPRRWVEGAPSGFSRNAEGAQAAAAAYATLGGTLLNADPISLRRLTSSISTADSSAEKAKDLQESAEAVRQRLAGGTGPYSTYQAPVLVRVDAFDRNAATITLWVVSVLMRRDIAEPQSTWSTVTLHLEWEKDDWRLASQTTVEGPTPDQSIDDPPISIDEFEDRLRGARQVWGPR